MHVVVPDDIFEEVDEVRFDEGILRQPTARAIAKEIGKERPPAFKITEVVFAVPILQIAPMNQLGKRHSQVFIDMPTGDSKFRFEQIEQCRPLAPHRPGIEVPRRIAANWRIVDPSPRSGRVPECAVAPRLTRYGTIPMVENCKLLRETAEHGKRTRCETPHDRFTLIGG